MSEESEKPFFAKICSSTSRLSHRLDELRGGGYQRNNETLR